MQYTTYEYPAICSSYNTKYPLRIDSGLQVLIWIPTLKTSDLEDNKTTMTLPVKTLYRL